MASANAPKDTVREVKFSAEQKEKLRDYLTKEIKNCQNDREELMRKCRLWVEQANSRRDAKPAFSCDANIDMPLTRQRMMQNSARLLNPIFQQDVLFVSKPRNPVVEDMARALENLIDYISDQIDYRSLCDDWVEQFQTFPLGVVKTPFVYETERVLRWQELKGGLDDYNLRKLNGEKVTIRKLEDGTEKYFIEVDEDVTVRVGAFPEVVPFEDFFIPRCSTDIRTADWVAHRIWMTKPQLKSQIKKKVYKEKDGDDDILNILGEPSADREKLLRLEESKNPQDEYTDKQYEIFEVYLKWDVDGKEDPVEIIVTMDLDSGAFLRCIHNFYHAYRRPFVAHQYKSVQGSLFGVPLTYILEPLHIAYSASFNQRLDAASKANETLWAMPVGSELKPLLTREGLRTGFVETTANKDEMWEIKLSQPFTQLPELEQRIVQEADKLSSLSDYSFGQEQIDRPTASGQIQIIEESKQPQYMQLERFRASLAEVCKHVLARYKQFYPEGLRYYKMQDEQGSQLVEMFFSWPEGVIEKDVLIETKVTSASMSKSLRKQELVALVDKMGQLYQQMMQFAMVASDPMNPGALIAAQLLNGLWTVVNDMLTEFEVGKKDALNPKLVEVTQVVQQIQQQMQSMVQQINQLGQQNQQLQAQNASVFGGGGQGPGMAQGSQPPPGVQGPPNMAGPPQGPGGPPPNFQ